jgi:CTP:molybdopterin cytidylyltransferase MocA
MTNSKVSVCAIIPAAGRSKRMGSFKYLLPFIEKKTVIECCIENLFLSNISDIYVVLSENSLLIEAVKKYPVNILINDKENTHMADSIKIGLNSVKGQNKGVLIALGDQPFIQIDTYKKIIESFTENSTRIVIPCFNSRKGHPVIFPLSIIKDLYDNETLRDVIEKHKDKVLLLNVDDEGILLDIDTEEDYNYLLKLVKNN